MTINADRRYVEQHFWRMDELAEAVGATADLLEVLIAARCAPGPIYILGKDGWWSALDGDRQPLPNGPAWYSPGAAWGLRHALLAIRKGASHASAATLLEETFSHSFLEALIEAEGAELAFPNCFIRGKLDVNSARRAAQEEWKSWLDGGYGVCLRVFTGHTCVAKETLGASLKAALACENYDPVKSLLLAEALAGYILPFAPWQRPTGTPGRTIDRLLSDQALGRERPYSTAGEARVVLLHQ